MRVTTQMLNESAQRAGLPINGTSLLNYINNDDSENTLLSALSRKNSGAANTIKKSSYEKLETASEQLQQKAEFFTDEEEGSVFDKARESENSEKICDAVEQLVKQYNDTLSELNNVSGTLNDYYKQQLKAAASENSEALKAIGITIAGDGTLTLDEEQLKAADVDTLEKALGTSATFSTKTAYLAAKISANAEANIQSLTSQYNSTGSLYSAACSKYDFWG